MSEMLARRFAGSALCQRAERIALYLQNDAEMDPAPLVARLWRMGKRVYLPVLHGPKLWFMRHTPASRFTHNRFGIPEPDLPAGRRVPLLSLDLVLLPLVAFDNAGNRLGMGGGFYDRTFAHLRERRHLRRPRLVGVAYEMQRLAALPVETWDVPLAGIVTARGLQHFGGACAIT